MRSIDRRRFALAMAAASLAAPAVARVGASLRAAVDNPHRSPDFRARDRYRHPAQSLAFWGLSPGMTVVEIEPSGGYWTEILAPYLNHSGGRYIAAVAGDTAKFQARFADRAQWGPIEVVAFRPETGPLVADGAADMVLTARNIHDWMWTSGLLENYLGRFHAALRPHGILAVEEHRADPRPIIDNARDGYVTTAFVVEAARKAGFALEASSEINANPRDTKDYPFGVWTLPPTRRTHERDKPTPPGFDAARYEAIGESDRMTLRFRKA